MSLIWIICGAGRGVGKTTLAGKLCEILPDSVYAKCGRSNTKSDKPGSFFSNIAALESFIDASRNSSKHIIVESNALAGLDQGNIVIFIDGAPGKTNFRNDTEKLRAVANLQICKNALLADWKKTLVAKVNSKPLRRAVCDCLVAQKRHLFGSNPVVRSKVWFETTGAHIFGGGLARLLENINRSGTLQDAAKTSGMSYRYAWDLIRIAEDHLGKTLIECQAGGSEGGSSVLSVEGQRLLKIFRQLNEEVASFADERFSELCTKEKVNV